MKRNIVLFSAILLLVFSCKKATNPANDQPNEPVSDTPVIELLKFAPTTVTQFKDSILFTVKYLDGDGDLGYKNADSASLFLTDNRASLTETYHIPPLAPEGKEIAIEGNLIIKLDRTALLDTSNTQETTTYSIKLKDRAGNWSNTITTGSITIKK